MSEPSSAIANYEPKPGAGKGVMALKELDFKQMMYVGELMYTAQMFTDLKSAAQAQVKIMAGQELGLAPMQSMNAFHIIHGRVTMAANTMAAKVLESGRYRYRVLKLEADGCILLFEEREGTKWVPLGKSEFTAEDAKAAGTQNTGKFARNMYFARAVSNGVKWYCPDIFTVAVYVDGEVVETDPPAAKTEAEEQAELDAAAARLNRRKKAATAGQKGLKVEEATPEPETAPAAPSEPTEAVDDTPEPPAENHESKPEPATSPQSAQNGTDAPAPAQKTAPTAQVEGAPETYMAPVQPNASSPENGTGEFATTPADTSGPHTTDQRDQILKYLDEMGFTTESDKKAIFTGLTTLSSFKDLTKAGADTLIDKLQNTDDPEALRGWFIDAKKSPADGA